MSKLDPPPIFSPLDVEEKRKVSSAWATWFDRITSFINSSGSGGSSPTTTQPKTVNASWILVSSGGWYDVPQLFVTTPSLGGLVRWEISCVVNIGLQNLDGAIALKLVRVDSNGSTDIGVGWLSGGRVQASSCVFGTGPISTSMINVVDSYVTSGVTYKVMYMHLNANSNGMLNRAYTPGDPSEYANVISTITARQVN